MDKGAFLIQLCYGTIVSYALTGSSLVTAGPDQERSESRTAQSTSRGTCHDDLSIRTLTAGSRPFRL